MILALGGLFLATGCEEEVPSTEYEEQEIRYFDLYMSSTYKDSTIVVTESGLNYIEVSRGNDTVPDEDDWVKLNYVGYTIPGDQVVDTYLENVAIDNSIYQSGALYGSFKMQNGFKADGVTEGLTMMGKGGKAILCFTSDLGYGNSGTQLMKSVGAYTSMKYELELLEVIKDIVVYEQDQILNYANNIEGALPVTDSATETVMYYVKDVVSKEGSQVDDDSIVQIAYKGYLIDGRVFDESSDGDPYEFKVGDYGAESSPIVGWHLGVKQFREGEKGRLIIPYPLAYGEMGKPVQNYVAIPPYETLVFDIEIVSVDDSGTGTDPDLEK